MRALKQIREAPSGVEGSIESLLSQFSASTLELNPSLGFRELCRCLTARTAQMFRAKAAVLVLVEGGEWRIATLDGTADRWEDSIQRLLAWRFAEQATKPQVGLRSDSAPKVLGTELSEALGWRKLSIVRMTGRGGTTIGVLCLADVNHPISAMECQIFEALASHASVAIENVRMIGKIERSRKQWVEDFDAISDLIVVHDSTNRILRLNRALSEQLGLHPAEAIGEDIGDLKILGSPSQQGRCPFCHSLDSPREESVHQVAGRTYLISTAQVNSDGGAPRTIHALKDITDRKEVERRYRRERDFNKNILNSTQSMILVLDTAGLISYANRRCMEAGFQEHELLGRHLSEFVPPKHVPTFLQALEATLEGAPVEIEIPLSRGARILGQFSVALSPMRDEQGEINSIVVAIADITDAAAFQARLVHTEKMAALGQLVSGVAHEVNNPLAAIVGFTDLLLENPDVPGDAKEELQVILQEAQRTRVIVQNLLSFARQMPAQHEPVQVASVLKQTVKLRAYDFSNHGIELIECYEDEGPLVVADRQQLQQVFLNILNNAYDAVQESPRPGKIAITTSHRNGQLEVSFRDNGSGISHPDRIFDPFFTTKEVGKGTGLGLSICYGIIRAHHGEISAQNNPDGIGCTFVVRLPAARTPAECVAAEVAGGCVRQFVHAVEETIGRP